MTQGRMGEQPEVAAVALGSNLTDRVDHLQAGLDHLARCGRVVAVSGVYETAPVGDPHQPDYLNAVALVETALGPEALLAHLLAGEVSRGRIRTTAGGARTLDLDLILFGSHRVSSPALTLPHPRWKERSFVLAPLAEVAPGWMDPEEGGTVAAIWERIRATLPPARRVREALTLPGEVRRKPARGPLAMVLLVAALMLPALGCGEAGPNLRVATGELPLDSSMVLGSDDGVRRIAAELLPVLSRKAGMDLTSPITVERRSRSALEAFLLERLDEELPPDRARGIAEAYHLLGLVPADLDLRGLLLEVYLEQVAGYYDPATSTMYLLEDQPEEATRGILLHELVHAVQDQTVDLESLTSRGRGSDARSAAQAAVEGHATLIMLEAMSEELQGREMDLSQVPDFSRSLAPALEGLTGAVPALARAPAVIRESLFFPYVSGAAFVHALWRAEGDRVPPFDSYLPMASVDVLHPGDFLTRVGWEPLRPEVVPPTGHRVIFTETLGAQDLRLLLRELGDPDPLERVREWYGDVVTLLEHGDGGGTTLVHHSFWRTAGSRDAFLAALAAGMAAGEGHFPAPVRLLPRDDLGPAPAAVLEVGGPLPDVGVRLLGEGDR